MPQWADIDESPYLGFVRGPCNYSNNIINIHPYLRVVYLKTHIFENYFKQVQTSRYG